MGLAHEKKSYLQEKANLFEIGSIAKKRKYREEDMMNCRESYSAVVAGGFRFVSDDPVNWNGNAFEQRFAFGKMQEGK